MIKQIFDRIISVLLPKRCVLCGGVVAYDELWCGKCAISYADVVEVPGWSVLDAAASPVVYGGNARSAVLRLKKAPDLRTALFFAKLMHERVKTELHGDFDMLVPVPLSRKKLSERGFNHADILARELGALMGAEVGYGVLLRNDFAESQHMLTASKRMVNAKQSYTVRDADKVSGRKILLVDDICTTGATVSACALLLKDAGAESVSAVTATSTRLG